MDIGRVIVHNKLYLPLLNFEKKIDNKGFGEAVLMYLPKAFYTLNHEFLFAKLRAYMNLMKLHENYFIAKLLQTDGIGLKSTTNSVFGLNY